MQYNLEEIKATAREMGKSFRNDCLEGRLPKGSPEREIRAAESAVWNAYAQELEAINKDCHEEYLNSRYFKLNHISQKKLNQLLPKFNNDWNRVGRYLRNLEHDPLGINSKYSVVKAMEWIL